MKSTTHIEPDQANDLTTFEKTFRGRRALKINETARAFGVAPKTIRRAIDHGLITPCRAFRHILIPVEELDRFISENSKI